MDARSKKQVFIGYNEESKGYKMIDPFTNKVTINRDVVFEEGEKWDWKSTKEEIKHDVLDWGIAYENKYNQGEESEDEVALNEYEENTADSNHEDHRPSQMMQQPHKIRQMKTPIPVMKLLVMLLP